MNTFNKNTLIDYLNREKNKIFGTIDFKMFCFSENIDLKIEAIKTDLPFSTTAVITEERPFKVTGYGIDSNEETNFNNLLFTYNFIYNSNSDSFVKVEKN